jgi:hypothetical protein
MRKCHLWDAASNLAPLFSMASMDKRSPMAGGGPRNVEEREDKPTGVIAREGSPSRQRDGVPKAGNPIPPDRSVTHGLEKRDLRRLLDAPFAGHDAGEVVTHGRSSMDGRSSMGVAVRQPTSLAMTSMAIRTGPGLDCGVIHGRRAIYGGRGWATRCPLQRHLWRRVIDGQKVTCGGRGPAIWCPFNDIYGERTSMDGRSPMGVAARPPRRRFQRAPT